MSFVLSQDQATGVEVAGGKAAALSRLVREGFAPPAFFVILPEGFTHGKTGPVMARGLKAQVMRALGELGEGPFAVRSSGRAEDGAEHSHAGQFDTILNVETAGVLAAAKKVWQSGFG